MACAVCYQGGVAVAIALAAIYAEQVIGFQQQETMVLIFVLNLAAAPVRFAWGYLQDRIGPQAGAGHHPGGLDCHLRHRRASPRPRGFWWAAAIAGCAWGPASRQGGPWPACSRRSGSWREFYGLWTFAIRLASIVGPLSYGAITWATGGNQRTAILSTAVLFVVGLLLLQKVNVQRGRAAALAADARQA
jgi:UMF1 family MFS transporter